MAAVSIEAINYIKSCDFGANENLRLMMFAIAENTFNDSFVCKLSREKLARELGPRKNERTARRKIEWQRRSGQQFDVRVPVKLRVGKGL